MKFLQAKEYKTWRLDFFLVLCVCYFFFGFEGVGSLGEIGGVAQLNACNLFVQVISPLVSGFVVSIKYFGI